MQTGTRAGSAPAVVPPVRTVRRRRPLPGGRAVLGGLLVSVAMVGTFAAATRAGDSRAPYVVARSDLPVGHTLARSDLAVALVDAPIHLRDRTFADPARLVGATVLAPLARGELVQASHVRSGGPPPGGRELSVPVDRSRAVGGALRPGEAVDVVATFGSGQDAYTLTVAEAAFVVALEADASTGGPAAVLTLRVRTAEEAQAVAHAAAAGTVVVVRRPAGGAAASSRPYRAPAGP